MKQQKLRRKYAKHIWEQNGGVTILENSVLVPQEVKHRCHRTLGMGIQKN